MNTNNLIIVSIRNKDETCIGGIISDMMDFTSIQFGQYFSIRPNELRAPKISSALPTAEFSQWTLLASSLTFRKGTQRMRCAHVRAICLIVWKKNAKRNATKHRNKQILAQNIVNRYVSRCLPATCLNFPRLQWSQIPGETSSLCPAAHSTASALFDMKHKSSKCINVLRRFASTPDQGKDIVFVVLFSLCSPPFRSWHVHCHSR